MEQEMNQLPSQLQLMDQLVSQYSQQLENLRIKVSMAEEVKEFWNNAENFKQQQQEKETRLEELGLLVRLAELRKDQDQVQKLNSEKSKLQEEFQTSKAHWREHSGRFTNGLMEDSLS